MEAGSNSMGELLLICECHKALARWNKTQTSIFIEQKTQWFTEPCLTSAYLVMVVNMMRPNMAGGMRLCLKILMIYNEACFLTVNPTEGSAQANSEDFNPCSFLKHVCCCVNYSKITKCCICVENWNTKIPEFGMCERGREVLQRDHIHHFLTWLWMGVWSVCPC